MAGARPNVVKLAVVTFFGLFTGFGLFLLYRRRINRRQDQLSESPNGADIRHCQQLQKGLCLFYKPTGVGLPRLRYASIIIES